MTRTLRIALGVAISAVFLGFAARGVDWVEAASALREAHYVFVIPMLAATVWSLYIRAQRWRILLRPVGTPAMRTLVSATNIGFMAVVIGAAVALARWQEAWALRCLQRVLRPLPARLSDPMEHFFRGFVRALEILESPLTVANVLGWSLYLWVVNIATSLFGILAFDLPVPLIVGSIVVTAVTAVAVSAPSAPGYIGAFQVGCTLSLAIFGVAKSEAFAFSIVLHVSQFVGVVGAGLYSLAREGMTLRQMDAVSESSGAVA